MWQCRLRGKSSADNADPMSTRFMDKMDGGIIVAFFGNNNTICYYRQPLKLPRFRRHVQYSMRDIYQVESRVLRLKNMSNGYGEKVLFPLANKLSVEIYSIRKMFIFTKSVLLVAITLLLNSCLTFSTTNQTDDRWKRFQNVTRELVTQRVSECTNKDMRHYYVCRILLRSYRELAEYLCRCWFKSCRAFFAMQLGFFYFDLRSVQRLIMIIDFSPYEACGHPATPGGVGVQLIGLKVRQYSM